MITFRSNLIFRLSSACLAVGVYGCSQPTGSVQDPVVSPPSPPRVSSQAGPEEAIRRVKEASAPDGTSYATWIKKRVASEPGRVLFSDWSATRGKVRFSCALCDAEYRITTFAFEWRLDETSREVPPPRRVTIAREVVPP